MDLRVDALELWYWRRLKRVPWGRWDGGLGWGTHVNPWLIHVNVWQKPQYCKVISLQLIKINEKKKRVPWTARSSNQSILKEINPEYSLERLMLKLQYSGSLDAKSRLIGKDPDIWKD